MSVGMHSPFILRKKTKLKIKEFCQNIRRSRSKFAWNQTFSDIYVSKRITLDTLCLLILLFINTQVFYTICARWTETYNISLCRVSHRRNIAQVICVATRQNIKVQHMKDTTITASFRFFYDFINLSIIITYRCTSAIVRVFEKTASSFWYQSLLERTHLKRKKSSLHLGRTYPKTDVERDL